MTIRKTAACELLDGNSAGRRAWSVCLGLVLLTATNATITRAADPVSMTLLAPGMVTDLSRVEARVSIQNPSDQGQSYSLELYLDSSLGTQTLAATNITVPAQSQELHSSWFPTTGLGGQNLIRYRVTPSGGPASTGQTALTVAASDTRAVPLITAAWIDPGAVLPGIYAQARRVNAQDVRDSVDAAYAVGVDTLIITYSEYLLIGAGAFYSSTSLASSSAGFDVVGSVLNQASQNGQRVFVGLGRGDDLLLTWNGFDDAQRNAAALAHGTTMANELWGLYSDEPSFYGWYLTHEANAIGPASESYYNPMVEILRQFEADKPVMISPAGTPIISPQILADSAVDVFTYQDAVGSGYIPYVNTFDPQRRIDTLDAVFGSYQSVHQSVNKHLWANLENWQMDGPIYGNSYPADFSRLRQQLEIEKNYVDVLSSYEWLGFMTDPESTAVLGGQRAVDLYVNYRDYYSEVRPTLKTVNYVANAGFENGLGPGAVSPTGWQFTSVGPDQSVSLSTDTPTGTATSVSIDIDQADGLALLLQDIPVVAGAEYKFSAWAKQLESDPSGGRLAAQVWMLSDAASESILDSAALLYLDAAWDFQSTLITAPPAARIARLVLAVQDNAFAAGSGHYLIDGVSLVGPPLFSAADFNRDGQVDGGDLALWQAHFGNIGDSTSEMGDANNDGHTGGADFLAWQARVGGLTSVSSTAVPEPSTAMTIVMAGAILCWRLASARRIGVQFLTAIVAATSIATACSAGEGADLPTKTTPGYASSMTLVPPVKVSSQVEVEIRVAVRNHTTNDARFELVLSTRAADGRERPLFGSPMEAAKLGQQVISHRLPTNDLIGINTIRYQIKGPDGFKETGSWPLQVVDCQSRAVPTVQIGWIDPGAMVPNAYPQRRPPTEQDLRDAMDAYLAVGITGLIITYPESIYLGNGLFYPSRVFQNDGARVAFDVVGTILDQASKNGQHVFVGLGRGPDLLLTWTGFDDALRKRAALAHSMKTATELWALYGEEPSFYGWYLTHETNDIVRASKAYYNPITEFLRTFEADKPVLISPSGTPILSPAALAESKVNIFAYQDAVGSGYVPYKNTFDPQRRIDMLPEVFAGYARAHRDSGKHLWANLEIWQMDGPEYGKSYAPEFERVQRQLEIEQQHVDVITAYTLSGFMEPPASGVELGGPRAVRLFEAYRDYYQDRAKELGWGSTSLP